MLIRLICILMLVSAITPALGILQNRETDPQYQNTDPQDQDVDVQYQNVDHQYQNTDPQNQDVDDPCQKEIERILREFEDEYQAEILSRSLEVHSPN